MTHMWKKMTVLMGTLLTGATLLQAQVVKIDALQGNGRLTATVPPNSVYSVEWSNSLESPQWHDNWSQLRGVASSNGVVDVSVPMFYRLSCSTNGWFVNVPIGRTFTYSVSNALGQTWSEVITVVSDTYIPSLGHSYRVLAVNPVWSGTIPSGAPASAQLILLRPTANDASIISDSLDSEIPYWKNAGAGSNWTYVNAGDTNAVDVAAIENVTVGAGSYTNCLKIHRQDLNPGASQNQWNEWIKPGFFMVKWEDYAITDTNAAPVVYELQSWSDQ